MSQADKIIRYPILFLVHANASMSGTPIFNLSASLKELLANIKGQENEVEVGILTVNNEIPDNIEWTTIKNGPRFALLKAEGDCSLSDGIDAAMRIIGVKIAQYNRENIDYYTPTLVIISDNLTAESGCVFSRLKESSDSGDLVVFAFATSEKNISPEAVACLKDNLYAVTGGEHNFSGFKEIMSLAVSNTLASSPVEAMDYEGLLDEIFESIPLKKIQ